MNILFLGDVVADSGHSAVIRNLGAIQKKYNIEFTVINAENAANGKGITFLMYNDLVSAGADVLTLGNHAFSKKEIISVIEKCPFMVRPANLEPLNVGHSVVIRETKTKRIAVVNLLGRVFMNNVTEDPIVVMRELLKDIDADIIIVDFHGEATSEKALFARYFSKSLTAVIGTHTHVQTADERLIDGCAFISDAGMCGAYESILGRNIDEVISNMVDNHFTFYQPAKGEAVICGCVVSVDDETNRAVGIERIQYRPGDQIG